jgi:nifR3 family TIM-barrel protein
MQLRNLLLKNKVILAPMAGITNYPFRALLRDFGCALAFTEMISANGLTRGSTKTRCYLESSPADRPLAVQLFGSDPFILAEGARIVAGYGADMVDINMGCPAKKVLRSGAGAALLKDSRKVARIIEAVRKAVLLPLTVKIRSGWQRGKINAVEISRIAEDCGADGVIVHPRTADQGFGGSADWDVITDVKRNLHIPIIGNGDIKSAEDALHMLQRTACDGIMIGRGALGNPWLIRDVLSLTEGSTSSCPSLSEREMTVRRHLAMEVDYSGQDTGNRNFRKHLLWYTKGLPGSAKFRNLICNLKDKDMILKELHGFFQSGSEHIPHPVIL